MRDASPRIALLGHHELDYPRNRCVAQALHLAGFETVQIHSRASFPQQHFILAWKYLRRFRNIDLIWVTEGGHRLVPWVRFLAFCTRRKVLFDPFLSRYNTRVEDRRLHSPRSLQALICKWQDASSTWAAHALVFDTEEHRRYFYTRYRLSKPYLILPVSVDESVFDPKRYTVPKASQKSIQVLFYGSYIPLQGIETIVEAAQILERETGTGVFNFTLIGKGQTRPLINALAHKLQVQGITFIDFVPEAELPKWIASSDIVLGIFGVTLKADQVIPNKVVQAAAMGAALITRKGTAINRYFADSEQLLSIEPGSPQQLAKAIKRLNQDENLRHQLQLGIRKTFGENFSLASTTKSLRPFLESFLRPRIKT